MDRSFFKYIPGPVEDKIRALIKIHEGLRLHCYIDSRGYRTVGYGHRLRECDVAVEVCDSVSLAMAEKLLTMDIRIATAAALRWLDGADAVVEDARLGAVVDMAFNLGAEHLATFRRMRACLSARDWYGASHEMLNSKWAREVTKRAVVDAAMMEGGEWPKNVDV